MKKEKKFCKNCIRWFFTKADICDIPACGLDRETELINKELFKAVGKKLPQKEFSKVDLKGQEFIKTHERFIYFTNKNSSKVSKISVSPSELNKNNDCYFHKALPRGLRFLTGLVRIFYS